MCGKQNAMQAILITQWAVAGRLKAKAKDEHESFQV
jgi:hypothetical protein